MHISSKVRPLFRVFVPGVVALVAIIGTPYLIAMAMQASTPPPFDHGSPVASPEASPFASPVAKEATGSIIATLHDENGDPIGGACWQLLNDDEIIAEGCDIEGDFGMNGRYGFFDVPPGEYTIIQSLSPSGAVPVNRALDVEIVGGKQREVVIVTAVETVASPPSVASSTAIASPVSLPTTRPGSSPITTPVPRTSTPVTIASPVASPVTPTETNPVSSPSDVNVTGVVAGTGGLVLNCRAQPDTGAQILMTFPPDSQVTIRGTVVNGWLPVDCNGQDGWVSAVFVRIEP